MSGYAMDIHDELSKYYREIREANKAKQERLIALVYAKAPRIKQIDDEISNIALNVAGSVLKGDVTPSRAIQQMQADIKALTDEKIKLLSDANYPADIMKDIYNCERCRDRGQVEGARCECYLQKRNEILQKLSNMNISEKNSFDKFNVDLFSDLPDGKYGVSPRENIKSVYGIARSFARGAPDAPNNLLFYGATGLGKTFTSDCIAKSYIEQGKTVFYMSAPKMFSVFENYKFGRDVSEIAQKTISSVATAELLIIDDLGTEFKNSFSDSILFDIINSRIIEEKPMIISTNLSIKDLKHIYSERIYSRILGYFNVVLFFGEDLRLKGT